MLSLGLTSSERGAYERALRSSGTRRVSVDVYDLNGNILSSIDSVLIDGQVNVDMDAEVSRSASLTYLDPNNALNFDTDSPDDGALYADRMIRIWHITWVAELERHVEVPVFTGPITGLQREGAVVTIEAQGKEALTRGAIWHPLTLKKGATVTGAIWTLLHDRGGETQFDMPTAWNGKGRQYTLPRARSLPRTAEIWATARSLARSINRQLFYNGAGRAVLRPWPDSTVFTFTAGDGGSLVTPVGVTYNLADVKNTVEVIGAPPSDKKAAVRAVAGAPRDHALSPWRLARNGVPRYLLETVEDQSIRSVTAAQELADRVLSQRLLEAVEVKFDSIPIPHLDAGDMVRVQTPEFTTWFRLRQFAIPLAPSGAPVMPVGYLKRVTPSTKAIRRRGSKR